MDSKHSIWNDRCIGSRIRVVEKNTNVKRPGASWSFYKFYFDFDFYICFFILN